MKFIYSAGGYARELLRCARGNFPGEDFTLVDDGDAASAISYEEAARAGVGEFLVAFAGARLRREKTARVQEDGFGLFSVRAETAIVGDNVELGPGHVLSDFSILTADARIGESFHANIYSYVAHDCEIGDFVTLAPRASVNGRVHIEDDVYVGTGATILPGKAGKAVRIGKGAIIGAHALVTKDVPAGVTVVGAPARILEKS